MSVPWESLAVIKLLRNPLRVELLCLALLAAVTHWFAAPDFFFVDDFRSLDWARKGWDAVRGDLSSLYSPWQGADRPVIMLKIQFIVATKMFGAWFPGHVLLASLPHIGATLALFHLARRLMPSGSRVPVVAALLFAVAPGTGLLAWPSAVHHAFLTLATLLLSIAYLRFKDTGSKGALIGVVIAACAIYFISEAATTSLLAPIWIELAGRRDTAPRRSRWFLVAFCVAGAVTRFITTIGWSSLLAKVKGGASVFRDSPHVYTLDLDPVHLVRDLGRCFGFALGLPLVAVVAVLVVIVVAAVMRRPFGGPAIRFGLLGAVFMAAPLAALSISRPWDGYTCAPWLILAIVGALAILFERARDKLGTRAPLLGKVAVGVVAALAIASVIMKIRTPRYFYGDLPEQLRATYAKLDVDLPRGRVPGTLVLYGIPTQVHRSFQPAQMDRFWSGLLNDRRPHQIVIISPHAAQELSLGGRMVWARSEQSWHVDLVEPVRRYRLTGGGSKVPDMFSLPPTGIRRELVPCSGADCIAPEDAPPAAPRASPPAGAIKRADLDGTFLAPFASMDEQQRARVRALIGPAFLDDLPGDATVGLVLRDGSYKITRTPVSPTARFEVGAFWGTAAGDVVFSSDCSTGTESTATYRVQTLPDGTQTWTLVTAPDAARTGCLPGPWGMMWIRAPTGHIAYTTGDPTRGATKTRIAVLDFDRLEFRKLQPGRFAAQPVWSPDGKQIAFGANDGKSWDQYLMAPDGSNARLLTGGPGDQLDATFSPDGARIALHEGPEGHNFEDASGNIEWTSRKMMSATTALSMVTVADATKTLLRKVPGFIGQTAWSPDGNTILLRVWSVILVANFLEKEFRITSTSIWTIRPDGSGLTKVYEEIGGGDTAPVWTPDGSRIVFWSSNEGSMMTIRPDGTNLQPFEPSLGGNYVIPSWSPDGRWIAVSGIWDSVQPLWLVSADGAYQFQLDAGPSGNVKWRPRTN
jgi:hypothetical protein